MMACSPCNPQDVDTFLKELRRRIVLSTDDASRYAIRVIGRRMREGKDDLAREMYEAIPGGGPVIDGLRIALSAAAPSWLDQGEHPVSRVSRPVVTLPDPTSGDPGREDALDGTP